MVGIFRFGVSESSWGRRVNREAGRLGGSGSEHDREDDRWISDVLEWLQAVRYRRHR